MSSDFTQSTLTSPQSPLFSDSDIARGCEAGGSDDSQHQQSGSEIVTSDEEPDLGAFTTVLRAWGYLQPPLRIPTHFQSSSSSNELWTPTTITGYPGFGGGNRTGGSNASSGRRGGHGSTVWNRIPIQSYLRMTSFGTTEDVSSGRTERARVIEEYDDDEEEEEFGSPPPSPVSDSARTVEIDSEVDVHSVSYEDGASGERLVVPVPVATSPFIGGRTVSVVSGLPIVNDNTTLSSSSPMPPLDDNTATTSRPPPPDSSPVQVLVETSSSRLRVVSNSSHAASDIINAYYAQGPGLSSPSTDQPVLDFPRPRRLEILAQPPPLELRVEQTHPIHHPLLEQDSPLPTFVQGQRRPSIIDDNSSTSAGTEDITSPPSASDSTTSESVLREMTDGDSPSSHSSGAPSHTIVLQAPSISASFSSTTTTTATATANHTRHSSLESSIVLPPSRHVYPSFTSTYREQQQQQQQQQSRHYTHHSNNTFFQSRQTGMRTTQTQLPTNLLSHHQQHLQQLHYHSLSSEGDPTHDQPSLGYLDEALSFIAQERVRWNAAREAGMNRGSSPGSGSGMSVVIGNTTITTGSEVQESREGLDMGEGEGEGEEEEVRVSGDGGVVDTIAGEGDGTWRYAIDSDSHPQRANTSQHYERFNLHHEHEHELREVESAGPAGSASVFGLPAVEQRISHEISSLNDISSFRNSEEREGNVIVALNSITTKPKPNQHRHHHSTSSLAAFGDGDNIETTSILKRPYPHPAEASRSGINSTMNLSANSKTTTNGRNAYAHVSDTLSRGLHLVASSSSLRGSATVIPPPLASPPLAPPPTHVSASTATAEYASTTSIPSNLKSVKVDGSTTPRAYTHVQQAGVYLYHDRRRPEEGSDSGDEDEDEDEGVSSARSIPPVREAEEERGGGVVEWYIDKYGRRRQHRRISEDEQMKYGDSDTNTRSSNGTGSGGGEIEWYIDKYGRRIRRSGIVATEGDGSGRMIETITPYHTHHHRHRHYWENESAGSDSVVQKSMEEETDEDEDEDEAGNGEEEDQEDESDTGRQQSTNRIHGAVIDSDDNIELDVENNMTPVKSSAQTKTKARKRKPKKKKTPVTVSQLPLSTSSSTSPATVSALTLLHSHSVPNLRSAGGSGAHLSTNTTTTTEEEEEEEDDDDINHASSSSGGGDRFFGVGPSIGASSSGAGVAVDDPKVDGGGAGDFPGLGPGLGRGLGLGSVSFPEDMTLSPNKKKKKKIGKDGKDKGKDKGWHTFLLRGDPFLNLTSSASAAAVDHYRPRAGAKLGFGFGFESEFGEKPVRENSRRARLIALARHLQVLFPEERKALGRVVGRLAPLSVSRDVDLGALLPTMIRKKKGKKKKGNKMFLDDCSLEYSSLASSDLQRAAAAARIEEDNFGFGYGRGFDEEDPDPRGDVPGRKDTLVHVFIDHSNILIGLLSYLKRMSRKLKMIPPSSPSTTKPTKTTYYYPTAADATTSTTTTGPRPLPIPKTKAGLPVPGIKPLIPLPSFATSNLSRSVPTMTKKVLTTGTATIGIRDEHGRGNSDSGDANELSSSGVEIDDEAEDDDDDDNDVPVFEFDDGGYGYEKVEEVGKAMPSVVIPKKKKQKQKQKSGRIGGGGKAAAVVKRSPHLWHAALALILERGRPVTRRVVVASSPLYQPMDDMERLGFEVSVLTRVPDLGDGADRLEKAAKYESFSYAKDNYTPDYHNGSPTKGSQSRATGKNHSRRISMNVNSGFDASSTFATNSNSVVGQQQQTMTAAGSTRVKYREQGVDELLQLKLLTVIATTNRVPEGATIILATGDGNVGQFNEDGYLGPVRQALKNGWKVELYAWEGGLSRSWLREFGPSSEWGKRGMFQVIAMEQFAECLVDLGY